MGLLREDAMLWLNWNPASVKWKLSWEVFKARLQILTRPSKSLSAALRSFNSNKMKTRRTKMQCPNLLRNCRLRLRLTRNRLRRLKKLLLLTWLSTERLNKNWKKPKIAVKWLKPTLLPSVNFKHIDDAVITLGDRKTTIQ